MQTLVYAASGLIILFVAVSLWGTFTEKLQEKTGSAAGDWAWHFVAAGLLGLVGGGLGLFLTFQGIGVESVFLTMRGLLVLIVSVAAACWMVFSKPD